MDERELGAASLAYLAAFDELLRARTPEQHRAARLKLERLFVWVLAEGGAERLYDEPPDER